MQNDNSSDAVGAIIWIMFLAMNLAAIAVAIKFIKWVWHL